MPDADTSRILEAVKEQGSRTEKAIESMADRIVDTLKHFVKKNGHSAPFDRGADVKMIAVVVAICFGLASPVGIVLVAVNERLDRMSMWQEADDQRDAVAAGIHAERGGDIAALNVRADMAIARGDDMRQLSERAIATLQEWQSAHDLRVVGINAAQWERIHAIERQVFGAPAPTLTGNGDF